MENFYYIHKSKILDYSQDLNGLIELSNDYDQQQTLHVPLSDQQVAFYLANPTATVQEVWNMELQVAPEPTMEEIKAKLFNDFDPVMNEFALMTSRCRSIYGFANVELEAVITLTNYVRKRTIDTINGFTDIEVAKAFSIRHEDINPLREKFKPFMF